MVRARLAFWLGRLAQPVLWRAVAADSEITLRLRGWLPVWVLAGVLVSYLAAPNREAAMTLAALGGLAVMAFGWARHQAGRVAARRTLTYAAMQVGDELEESVTIENRSPLPLIWVELVDHSGLPGYTLASARSVDSQSRLTWRARAVCQRRGRFTLGPWSLRFGDPFSLFLVEQTYSQQQEVVVYPPLAAVPRRLLPHTALQGEHRLLRQPWPADTPNALTVRPYAHGDPARHIHWGASARRATLFTRVFEPEAASRVWLALDFDPAVQHQAGPETLDDTTEVLVILAAALAAQLLPQRLAVGLVAANGPELEVTPPRPGPAHLWTLLRQLAALQPGPETPPLAAMLERVRPLISARDLVLALTPSLAEAWPRALVEAARRGARAEAILLDPASFGAAAAADRFLPALAGLGIAATLLRRGELQPLTAAYGAIRHWDFITTGTGRAVIRQTPRANPALEAQLAALARRPRA